MSEQRTKVAAFIQRYQLIAPGKHVVLAVSGGIDSIVMADILLNLQQQLGFYPLIASFDHQLRPESAEEIEFVAELARCWGVPFHAGAADIRRLAQGKNLEDVARQERYRFLRSIAYRYDDACIATAHHRDDQAETLLLHLLRGSGLAGLSGISPKENGLIRPLLCLSKGEIEAYAQEHNLAFRQDQSNFSCEYQRNRIRWELLPQLADYNPQIVNALNITADICREEDGLLDDLAENALVEVMSADDRLCQKRLAQLPYALARRVLRKFSCLRIGEGAELNFEQVEAILALREGQVISLPHAYLAFCRDGYLDINKNMPPLPSFEEEYPLSLSEQWQSLPGWGWDYCCLPLRGHALPPLAQLRRQNTLVYLTDSAALPKLYWRTRRDGDRLPSSENKAGHKLKELFIDKKILPSKRQSWPLLLDEQGIRWVPGLWKEEEIPEIREDMILIKARQSDNINKM